MEELKRLGIEFLKSGGSLRSCTVFIPKNTLDKSEIYVRNFKFSLMIN